MDIALLHRITGGTGMAERKAALLRRLDQYGGALTEPPVLAQFLAQLLHESGAFRYVREVWGPTAAQQRYEGRADLGNTQPGDGKRFMGRDLMQVTGRANYRSLTAWVRRVLGVQVDFEASPELLETPEWLGIGAIWYFLTRDGLLAYCRTGNIEMVTRRVNGGLNGYADRLRWYDKAALAMLGHPDVATFQKAAGIKVDGVSGPVTRAALHQALSRLPGPSAKNAASFQQIASDRPGWLVSLITVLANLFRRRK